MPSGLGMDLIGIARIERALDRYPRLAGRLFTDRELEYAASFGRPGRHLAARFAAKEAVVKALALGPGTSLREIEIVSGAPPEIRLHDDVRRIADERGLRVSVSLTHDREIAGAVAIAEAA
ncbi:MAG: holo-ACP synthase [Solirubrobacterales bacterium]|nr:holo-ACP synthase [Solirubrobacterales bacterium]